MGSGLTTDNRLPATDLNSWLIRGVALLVLLMAGLALARGLGLVLDRHRAEALCPTQKNSTVVRRIEPGLGQIQKALALTPGNPALWDRAGQKYLQLAGDQSSRAMLLALLQKAAGRFEEALRRSPANCYYWLRLGETRARLKILKGQDLGQEVLVCLERAVELRPHDRRFRERAALVRARAD